MEVQRREVFMGRSVESRRSQMETRTAGDRGPAAQPRSTVRGVTQMGTDTRTATASTTRTPSRTVSVRKLPTCVWNFIENNSHRGVKWFRSIGKRRKSDSIWLSSRDCSTHLLWKGCDFKVKSAKNEICDFNGGVWEFEAFLEVFKSRVDDGINFYNK